MLRSIFSSAPRGSRVAGHGRLALRVSLVLALVALLLVGDPLPLAHAVGSFDNAIIANKALAYENQWGGNACRDAGRFQSGQCKQFVNCVVVLAGGGYAGDGSNDYAGSYVRAGGVEISEAQAVKGDIIQWGSGTTAHQHTAIVVANLGSGKFDVVDANWNRDEVVHHHVINNIHSSKEFPSGGEATRFVRMGTPTGNQPSGPVSVSVSNNGGQMFVQLSNFPLGTTYFFCHAGSGYPAGGSVPSHGQVVVSSPNQSWSSGWCSGSGNFWVGVQATDGHDYYSNQLTLGSATATLVPVAPAITGTAQVGSTLTVDPGSWTPAPVSLSFQWYRSGVPIPGATSLQYLLVAADLGNAISVTVTGSRTNFVTATATSRPTHTVVAGTMTARSPRITGKAKVGKKLACKAGVWRPAGISFTYQWSRGGKEIKGATKSTYRLTKASKGKRISVRVTGHAAGYTDAVRTSKPTAKVKK